MQFQQCAQNIDFGWLKTPSKSIGVKVKENVSGKRVSGHAIIVMHT